MPYRKTEFINDEIYHVVTRRIGDNLLFVDTDDNYRGIFSIYEFNNANPVVIRDRRAARLREKQAIKSLSQENRERVSVSSVVVDRRDKLVEVLSFSFMPNHIHLLLRQLKDGGISKFMNKMGAGYAGYFREKYKLGEKGYFFQSRFSSVHIRTNGQLIAVFIYIHANPIALAEPGWKQGEVKDVKRALEFLDSYKWSSYQDYCGKKNFPSVTDRDFLLEVINEEGGAGVLVEDWIKGKKEIVGIDNIAIE